MSDADLMHRLGIAVARLERAARKQEDQNFLLHVIVWLSLSCFAILIGTLIGVARAVFT